MAGVSLVTAEIDSTVDGDREVGVDLKKAVCTSLEPVIPAPCLPLDILHGKTLAGRKGDVFERPLSAFLDGRSEDAVELRRGDDKPFPERRESLWDRTFPREESSEAFHDLFVMLFGPDRRNGVIQRL